MKKSLLLASAIAFSLPFSHFALAQNHNLENTKTNDTLIQKPLNQHNGCHCKMSNMFANLGLTADQQAKIQQIKEQARANMQENRQAMQDINNQIKALIQSEKLDTAELDKLVNQKTALIGAKIKNKIMIKNQIFNLLTPEQKAKFKQALDQMHQKYQNLMQGNGASQDNNHDNDVDDNMDD